MDKPSGTVVSLQDRAGVLRATIEVDVAAYCPRCAAGKGCGAGLLAAGNPTRQIEVDLGRGQIPIIGETVHLSLPPSGLLRAAGIAYGIPLLGALCGAGVAFMLAAGDAAAALLSLAGLAAGVVTGRRLLARGTCARQFAPAMERRA